MATNKAKELKEELGRLLENRAKCFDILIRTARKLGKLKRQERSLVRRMKQARKMERETARLIAPAINAPSACPHNWLGNYCDLCGSIRPI
jgi:hypothetical protein